MLLPLQLLSGRAYLTNSGKSFQMITSKPVHRGTSTCYSLQGSTGSFNWLCDEHRAGNASWCPGIQARGVSQEAISPRTTAGFHLTTANRDAPALLQFMSPWRKQSPGLDPADLSQAPGTLWRAAGLFTGCFQA